jgi:hypothetical protein
MPLLRRVAVVSVVALLALSGCGGGAGVKPAAWAKAVCTALTPWRTRLADLTSQTQRAITRTTTPPLAKRNLVGLLDGAATASETARRQVAGAGTPDVDDGDRIAAGFVRSLAATRDAYAHAKVTVAALDASDGDAFYARVGGAFDTLQKEYAASALDTAHISSAPLRQAFNEVPECR